MITLPQKPKIIEQKGNQATFEIEACYPGYGVTLGNSLRRVLLSSLPGAAVIGIKIKGIQHEFSTVPHVMEDVVQMILNLKQVRFKLNAKYQPDRVFKASLKIKGEKEVKAGDIKTSAELEVVNKNSHLVTLTNKKADLDMEIEVGVGLGYSSVEQRKAGKLETGKIAIDAIFTPVRKVNYSVEHMRVGERTDYDCLTILVETDGSITPKRAFLKTAQVLVDHYKVFTSLAKEEEGKKEKAKKEEEQFREKLKEKASEQVKKEKRVDMTKTRVEDLRLSARTISILQSHGIKTVAGLTKKTEEDLRKLEGLGDKSIVEIKRTIGKFGLILKQ